MKDEWTLLVSGSVTATQTVSRLVPLVLVESKWRWMLLPSGKCLNASSLRAMCSCSSWACSLDVLGASVLGASAAMSGCSAAWMAARLVSSTRS